MKTCATRQVRTPSAVVNSLGPASARSRLGCGGQLPDDRSDSLIGGRQVELSLQIQPELRIDSEPMPESQGSVPRHGTLSGNDLSNTIRRHGNFARKGSPAYSHFRELVSQNLSRVNDSSKHSHLR